VSIQNSKNWVDDTLNRRKLPVPKTSETYEILLEGAASSIESVDPDSLLRLLAVRLIMTSKDRFVKCKDGETIALLVDKLEKYDVLPVDDDEIKYYVSKTQVEAHLDENPSARVRDIKQLISESKSISEDDPISRYFRLRGEPIFVTKQNEVVGIVTPADLNKTPSKMLFYILISFFERLLIRSIEDLELTDQQVEGCIGFKRLRRAGRRHEQARRENFHLSLTECLSIGDLIAIAKKNSSIRKLLNYHSELEAHESLKPLEYLRNKIMHSGHFIIKNEEQLIKRRAEYERIRQHIVDLDN